MRETQMSEQDIRRLFERNSPYVDEAEVWAGVRRELAERGRAPRRRSVPLRAAATAVVLVLVAAGVCVGAVQVLSHMSGSEPVVVIGDPEMSLTSTTTALPVTTVTGAATETTTSGATETTSTMGTPWSPDATGEFAPFVRAWMAKGIRPMSVMRHPDQANGIVLRISAAIVAPPDGIFYRHQISRQAFLVTHELDLPFEWLDIVAVDVDGNETFAMGMNPQAGMAFAQDWSSGETLAVEAAQDRARATLNAVADATGVQGIVELSESADGRTMKMRATLPRDGEVDAYAAFLAQVLPAAAGLNRQGCLIAVFELSIDDADEDPILRYVGDYQLQSVSSWDAGGDFVPPWITPPYSRVP